MGSRAVISGQRKVQLIRVETDSVSCCSQFLPQFPIMEKLRKKSYRCDFQCVLGKRFIFRQLDDIRLYSMTLDIIFVTRWNIILITMRHRTHYSIIYLCNRVNISFIRHFIIILCFIHTISYNVKKIATPYLPSLEYPTLKHLSLPSSAKIFLKHLIINKAE